MNYSAAIAAVAAYQENLWAYWMIDRAEPERWDQEKIYSFVMVDDLYDDVCDSRSLSAAQFDAAFSLGVRAARNTRMS